MGERASSPEPRYVVYDGTALPGPVFRVVQTCPPTESDFRSYVDLGRVVQTYHWFRATAVSFFISLDAAENANRQYSLGPAIAELDLRDNRILWSDTGGLPGHISVWATPAALLTFVTTCT
jgi:hypothetical protein